MVYDVMHTRSRDTGGSAGVATTADIATTAGIAPTAGAAIGAEVRRDGFARWFCGDVALQSLVGVVRGLMTHFRLPAGVFRPQETPIMFFCRA